MLMLTYGVMGGIGFGMIYLPAVVCVGYYFEKKRSLATGIAVCGSGFGTFAFAPLATFLLEHLGGWRGANLVLAGLILNCAIFGALMRPLTYPKKSKEKPLMQRMYEEKRMQMERGSITGSYFTVTMPDGTTKQRLKTPLNADPGVHSSLALDQIAAQGQIHPVATLPTITESKVQEANSNGTSSSEQSPPGPDAPRQRSRNSESDVGDQLTIDNNLPRNASQPVFSQQSGGEFWSAEVSTELTISIFLLKASPKTAQFPRSIEAARPPRAPAISPRSAQSRHRRAATSMVMYVSPKNDTQVDRSAAKLPTNSLVDAMAHTIWLT